MIYLAILEFPEQNDYGFRTSAHSRMTIVQADSPQSAESKILNLLAASHELRTMIDSVRIRFVCENEISDTIAIKHSHS